MDETYIKIKGQWYYLYRTVDKYGETIDFLLTEHRDTEAALCFLKKAIRRHGVPKTITIDGSDANEAAIKRYNEEQGTNIIPAYGGRQSTIMQLWAFSVSFNGGFFYCPDEVIDHRDRGQIMLECGQIIRKVTDQRRSAIRTGPSGSDNAHYVNQA
jgi:hypothetical protein